ncbi:class I SAM-dependent methyltransferase [Streptomyces sp. TR06-5]|uniref:class I SAM-dependent methyltransferase n=1 Tax=unclassified Streptomyces TaxID=2593676 RepID=UPI0039A0F2C9
MPQNMRRPVFSRLYARCAGPAMERAGVSEHRRRLLDGLDGRVLEIGAGNGLNFPHYPRTVREVVAVEPEPRLRGLAVRAARHDAPVPVRVVDGTAHRIPAEDASFDAAVACLVLCSVEDVPTALAELRRVLRPGGRLHFFEHVRADSARMRRVQRVLDATVWPLVCGGCHTGRDTEAALAAAGFTVTDVDRFLFPDPRSPAATHILGTAVRADGGA